MKNIVNILLVTVLNVEYIDCQDRLYIQGVLETFVLLEIVALMLLFLLEKKAGQKNFFYWKKISNQISEENKKKQNLW